jgi:catechol 2,3-dioxygenase-like lactoylglutathione lyase family enzyme
VDAVGMTVSDMDRSVEFFSKVLSFDKISDVEVTGTEYERLQGVFGARLRINGLKASSGPGIEFLEYLAPRDGRPAPLDLRANDLAHWQTTLGTPSADGASTKIRGTKGKFVSPGVVEVPDQGLGFRRGFLARDPDGHGLQVIEK